MPTTPMCIRHSQIGLIANSDCRVHSFNAAVSHPEHRQCPLIRMLCYRSQRLRTQAIFRTTNPRSTSWNRNIPVSCRLGLLQSLLWMPRCKQPARSWRPRGKAPAKQSSTGCGRHRRPAAACLPGLRCVTRVCAWSSAALTSCIASTGIRAASSRGWGGGVSHHLQVQHQAARRHQALSCFQEQRNKHAGGAHAEVIHACRLGLLGMPTHS